MQSLVAAIQRFSALSAATPGAAAAAPSAGPRTATSSLPCQSRHISSRVTAAAAAALVVLALVSALVLHGAQGGSGSTLGGGGGPSTSTSTATQYTSAGTASPSGTAGGFQITPVVPTATLGGLLPSGTIAPNPPIQLTCGGCDQAVLVTVPKITIDDTQQNMVWTFKLNNHSGSTCPYEYFQDLALQDPAGQQHPGTGSATKSDAQDTNVPPGTVIEKTATCTFVPNAGATYVLTGQLDHFGCGSQDETEYGPQPIAF